jgi:bifunctional UDP-N-acetylglucosamine pyrophosphorylase / glucosamine-1-phosphate N-acetyltransferase
MNKKMIILAGGKGTRMNVAQLPKVLVKLNGRPMIDHVVSEVEKLRIKPVVVTGHGREKVEDFLGHRADYVYQAEQRGTGHAVKMVKDHLKDYEGAVLVMYGDQPLIKKETLERVFESYMSPVTMMTVKVDDYDGWRACFLNFGKIVRDERGKIKGIREVRDCEDDELRINELNPGYYCFDNRWLRENIDKLGSDNAQGEYYLTDLIELAVSQGYEVHSIEVEAGECLGVNDEEQLKIVEMLSTNDK